MTMSAGPNFEGARMGILTKIAAAALVPVGARHASPLRVRAPHGDVRAVRP